MSFPLLALLVELLPADGTTRPVCTAGLAASINGHRTTIARARSCTVCSFGPDDIGNATGTECTTGAPIPRRPRVTACIFVAYYGTATEW
jgi:hypothetical protein